MIKPFFATDDTVGHGLKWVNTDLLNFFVFKHICLSTNKIIEVNIIYFINSGFIFSTFADNADGRRFDVIIKGSGWGLSGIT